jgi:hypothetical protein
MQIALLGLKKEFGGSLLRKGELYSMYSKPFAFSIIKVIIILSNIRPKV